MSKTDLIPLLCPKGGIGGGAKAAESGAPKKRMIADADTAVIDDSMIPEPLVLYVAAIASVGTGAALFVGLAFKAAEWAMLVALPAVALAWGLTAAFFAPWTCATLELDAAASPPAVRLAGALVALAAYGALAAGISGCALNKAKVLPLVAVLFAAAVESPLLVPSDSSWPSAPVLCGLCTAKQLVVAVPALAALANSQAAAFTNYFTKSQKAAVEMAKRVRREARRSESLSRTSVGNCCCAEAR
jgi:uncharacterized membrane protein YphA (DoxX/SURF4 family)